MHNLFSNLLHKHNCCNIIVFALAVGALTPFAGAKHGSPTNDPPADISGDISSTNDPPPVMMGASLRDRRIQNTMKSGIVSRMRR